MNILSTWQFRGHRNGSRHPLNRPLFLSWIVESFWFCLTFALFLLMGPFSAPVVLIGLGLLASDENRERMSEPAHL